MKIEEVKKLSPLDRFCYWVGERHRIYLRRKAGQNRPWTDDEILQSQFFTNPYRENDKVTVWFRENVREPLRNDPRVLMATVIFRWFNLPITAAVLIGKGNFPEKPNLLLEWDAKEALKRLSLVRAGGGQIFTGAYMINSPAGKPKLEAIIERITKVWERREALLDHFIPSRTITGGGLSLQEAHNLLQGFDGLGGFMAYEIVCDLRYTYLLENTPDKLTWCNPGPGAVRGLYRILGRDFPKGNNATSPPVPKDWAEQTQKLLRTMQERFPNFPDFEMRECEMSLCEADKYERLLWGDGKSKRKYNGV